MPELPEVQAHCERLSDRFAGIPLERFEPLRFTALKNAGHDPLLACTHPLEHVARRGKYLLATFGPLTFVIHLMQGGRLKDDLKPTAKPKTAQARWTFTDGRTWLLTEAGSERKAGVWCLPSSTCREELPLLALGPDALSLSPKKLLEGFQANNMRLHGFLRHQGRIAGLGRLLANEICFTAKMSPFAMTGSFTLESAKAVHDAIHRCCKEGLAFERSQTSMSSSKERPAAVHHRTGLPCVSCSDTVREVSYSRYTVQYCATCQTQGNILADNTTSKFLK
jgi:formamidopyrimidine-DNA glycosylase